MDQNIFRDLRAQIFSFFIFFYFIFLSTKYFSWFKRPNIFSAMMDQIIFVI